ncbi:MAG: DinB family protein [Bacteroidota bacterium]
MERIELLIKMIVAEWQKQNKRVDTILETLSEEQLAADTAPGRNSGIYLIGHLVAVNDAMLPILGFGEKLHPGLDTIFLTNPDKSGLARPSLEDLKKYWKEINEKLTQHINKTTPEEWISRHTTVSEEDFAREPHRNKLNILINRTSHQSYHLGQLVYLK